MEALTWFDWITPIKALVGVALGRREQIFVASGEERVFYDLKGYGIQTSDPQWTWDIENGMLFMFTVPKRQHEYACKLMQSWGFGA